MQLSVRSCRGIAVRTACEHLSMTRRTLLPAEAERLRKAPFTYAEVGSTRTSELPLGYGLLRRSTVVGSGTERFERAARTVLGWDMHRRAGLDVRPSHEQVVEGAVAVVRVGVGPLGLNAPVRVVYVIEEANRQGFAYGTLPGHPESGEEAFVVERRGDGTVTFTVTAFSRPATWLARLGGPLTRAVQSHATNRYLSSV